MHALKGEPFTQPSTQFGAIMAFGNIVESPEPCHDNLFGTALILDEQAAPELEPMASLPIDKLHAAGIDLVIERMLTHERTRGA